MADDKQQMRDLAEAVAEYFNIYIGNWPKSRLEAAGRYIAKEAALRNLTESNAPEMTSAICPKRIII